MAWAIYKTIKGMYSIPDWSYGRDRVEFDLCVTNALFYFIIIFLQEK